MQPNPAPQKPDVRAWGTRCHRRGKRNGICGGLNSNKTQKDRSWPPVFLSEYIKAAECYGGRPHHTANTNKRKGDTPMKHTILLCTDTRKSQLIFLESTERIPNLYQHLHAAALEFCQTEEGRRLFLAGGGISYRIFFSNAPKELLLKYGIQHVDMLNPDLSIHPDSLILSDQDAAVLDTASETASNPQKLSVSETAACLGEMWGIMETLDGEGIFAEGVLGKNLPLLMEWAKEYAVNPCCSLAEFFCAKLEQLKRQGQNDCLQNQ